MTVPQSRAHAVSGLKAMFLLGDAGCVLCGLWERRRVSDSNVEPVLNVWVLKGFLTSVSKQAGIFFLQIPPKKFI